MFEIQHYTFCDGWVNTSTNENGDPVTFESAESALDELKEMLSVHIGPDCVPFDPDEYRVIGKANCPTCDEVNYYSVETGFIDCSYCKIAFQVGPIKDGIERPDILVTNEVHSYGLIQRVIEVDPAAIKEIRSKWHEIDGVAFGYAQPLENHVFSVLVDMHDERSFLVYLRASDQSDQFLGSLNVSYAEDKHISAEG